MRVTWAFILLVSTCSLTKGQAGPVPSSSDRDTAKKAHEFDRALSDESSKAGTSPKMLDLATWMGQVVDISLLPNAYISNQKQTGTADSQETSDISPKESPQRQTDGPKNSAVQQQEEVPKVPNKQQPQKPDTGSAKEQKSDQSDAVPKVNMKDSKHDDHSEGLQASLKSNSPADPTTPGKSPTSPQQKQQHVANVPTQHDKDQSKPNEKHDADAKKQKGDDSKSPDPNANLQQQSATKPHADQTGTVVLPPFPYPINFNISCESANPNLTSGCANGWDRMWDIRWQVCKDPSTFGFSKGIQREVYIAHDDCPHGIFFSSDAKGSVSNCLEGTKKVILSCLQNKCQVSNGCWAGGTGRADGQQITEIAEATYVAQPG